MPVTLRVEDQMLHLGNFSYNPPILYNITWDSGRTEGGMEMIISGINFGPFEAGVSAQNVIIKSKYPKIDASEQLYFVLTSRYCKVASINQIDEIEELRCSTPPGMGNNLDVILDISGQKTTGVQMFSYDKPRVTEVFPSKVDARMDITLTIRGMNFGEMPSPNLKVILGNGTCEEPYWISNSVRCEYRGGTQAVGPVDVQIQIAFQKSNQPYNPQKSLLKLICKQGYYAFPGEKECTKCSIGMYCAGEDAYPISTKGYWLWNSKVDVCIPVLACTGNNTCSKGYHGSFCSQCKTKKWCDKNVGQCDHYGFYRLEGECFQCPNGAGWRMLGIICAAMLFVIWFVVSFTK